MERPYLIQRLQKPYKIQSGIFKDNPFSFGGGLINGGLSKEAMNILRDIWNYDYMGSSEFEWGAVPASLQYIGKNQFNYTRGEFEVNAKSHDFKNRKDIKAKGIVYYVCQKDDVKEVKEWIEKFADDKKRNYRTLESVYLADNICEVEHKIDTVGWHDLDNHYLFFTDKTMFESFCNVFGF